MLKTLFHKTAKAEGPPTTDLRCKQCHERVCLLEGVAVECSCGHWYVIEDDLLRVTYAAAWDLSDRSVSEFPYLGLGDGTLGWNLL